ncbi:MAG: DUF484 family protein [Chromatiales bacterium]
MTTTTPNEAQQVGTTDPTSSVAEYLRKHREFFVEHPELLSDLVIPHETGKAVSLVEKQVAVLREENRQLKARFRELVNIARENEELSRRMHRLTLRLVEATSSEQIFLALEQSLRSDVAADSVIVRLFAQAADRADAARQEFAGPESPLRNAFLEVLTQRKPACGRLMRGQQQALFGAAAEEYGSAAVLPLFGKYWDGILVIASRDPRRYHPEMGIDLLAHLGDIVSLILNSWVTAPAA